MIKSAKEAREIAVKYWKSHYGNMTYLDDVEYFDNHYVFSIQSNYPIWNEKTKEVEGYLSMENLGEIIIHYVGAIVSATPRDVVIGRIREKKGEVIK